MFLLIDFRNSFVYQLTNLLRNMTEISDDKTSMLFENPDKTFLQIHHHLKSNAGYVGRSARANVD